MPCCQAKYTIKIANISTVTQASQLTVKMSLEKKLQEIQQFIFGTKYSDLLLCVCKGGNYLCAIYEVTFSKTFLAIDLFTFKNRVTRLEMKIPFFFGPLHTTASSRLFNKKPMDMTASR